MNATKVLSRALGAMLALALTVPTHALERQIYPSPEQASADIAARYRIPLDKGVPALAVLDVGGKLIYSQRTGEFEAMGHMQSSAVTEFLERWKPGKAP